jgi:hypothetical protein
VAAHAAGVRSLAFGARHAGCAGGDSIAQGNVKVISSQENHCVAGKHFKVDSWSKVIISTSLIIAAVIHLLPVIGLAGTDKLTKLYVIPIQEPNLLILMQHRAMLFGLLGAFLAYSAVKTAWQP